jgi:capsular exopolysaccharide synthesis family protein
MEFVDTQERIGEGQQEINFKKYLFKLLARWPYILGFFLLCVGIGYAMNRYATPVYAVTARMTTKKYSNRPETPVPGLIDASFFISGISDVYEEIPTLMSPKRIEAAVNKVDLRVSYFTKALIKSDTESTRGSGFDVTIDTILNSSYPFGVPIFVNHVDERTFELDVQDEDWHKKVTGEVYRFDEPFHLGSATLLLTNTNGKTAERDKYYFVLNRTSDLVSHYRRKLNINWAMRGSSMLDMRIETESPDRDLQFMRAYYDVVEEMGLQDKNETLENTIRFIETQMAFVTDSLIYYQELIDGLKMRNLKLTLGHDYVYSNLNNYDVKRAQIEMNERYLDYLVDYFKNNRDEDVFAPSVIGLDVPILEGWVNQYINAKLRRKNLLNENNSLNPLVQRTDTLGAKLEAGIYEAIRSQRQRNQAQLQDLERSTRNIYGSVEGLQSDSRELSKYQRMYQLNQTLFDLFLRRKTEAAISKASATSDYKLIDAPTYSKVPIRPDENQNLIIAAAIGLILPVGFFLTRDFLNTKIMDKDDLTAHTQIPLLGNVAHSGYTSSLVVKDHPRSIVSESFRSIRANLKYLVAKPEGCQTILITSSVGGEGKTFCSLNLACTLAVAGKRTILIAADLRKPQLSNYLERSGGKGLSEYLAGLVGSEEVLVAGEAGMPDIIDAGNVPPNPSELLGSERMAELIGYLKEHYEYIIIDTPPIGLVADAVELFKYSDYNILIVRQAVTHKQALSMINELYLEGKLKNFSVLFNDIEFSRRARYYGGYMYGMGYSGYGYGYYQEDKRR